MQDSQGSAPSHLQALKIANTMGPFPVVTALKLVENHKASLRCKYRAVGWALHRSDHYLRLCSGPCGLAFCGASG